MNFIKPHQDKFLFALLVVLFAAFGFLLFNRLGIHPYIDWDESIYAQVAKESLLNHRFFDFTYFGINWFEKPPLAFWLMSLSYSIGGVNEWTARIPSAIAALGMIIISLRWVYEFRKSYTAVLFTMAGYFIMFPFLTASYFVNLDTTVGLFALVALYAWWKSKQTGNQDTVQYKWFLIWGASIGLGVMTKSVLGLFPLVPIALFELIDWNFKYLKKREFWAGVAAAVLVAAPWHIYQSLIAGKSFWNNYLFYHVLQRYSTSLENNGAPFSYFFELVFYRYYLALVVFGSSILLSVWLAWKDRAVRFVLVATVILFLLFSSSTTKLPSYITMVLPLIAMLSGLVLAKLMEYVPKLWMRFAVVTILIATFVHTGFAFNAYKLAQGEFSMEYVSNKKTGQFLKDYRTELPVYINEQYKNLGIGYYAARPLIFTDDKTLIDSAKEFVFRQPTQQVLLGKDSQGKEYLLIKR